MSYFSKQSFTPIEETDHSTGETWIWYVRIKGNETELLALAHDVYEDENEEDRYFDHYEMWLTTVPEYEVDVLVKHSARGYFDNHNKLNGKLNWKENRDQIILNKAKFHTLYDITNNFEHLRMNNNIYFEYSDVLPVKFLVVTLRKNGNLKRIAVQYNGNEEQIRLFLNDMKNSTLRDNFKMEEIVNEIEPDDTVILGKFLYEQAVETILQRDRKKFIRETLNKGRIRFYME